ncbi:MAG: DUF2147 domain-containing protein [Reyranella sp.]|uniref:DUF2147 domain-containing protein n=1 Tax=Reyranella sp. TaxID=1929291 RepID=UPI001AC36E49|nr:DUF2147 domain-containing protein [Reyranella sp.]MBN9089221.1 DUF2147 domain-containing protein [Reyranella sp.]
MRSFLVLASAVLIASSASAQQQGVMGTWLTESGVAQVKIEPCADAKSGPACGHIVGLINPKGPDGQVVAPEVATDYRNENASLRSRKVIGMPLIWGFKKTNDSNAFEEGQIYNGEDGKTYTANISLQPDGKLRLRGYVGTPLFGKTQLWTRISQ